jgi:hypothetical protein
MSSIDATLTNDPIYHDILHLSGRAFAQPVGDGKGTHANPPGKVNHMPPGKGGSRIRVGPGLRVCSQVTFSLPAASAGSHQKRSAPGRGERMCCLSHGCYPGLLMFAQCVEWISTTILSSSSSIVTGTPSFRIESLLAAKLSTLKVLFSSRVASSTTSQNGST